MAWWAAAGTLIHAGDLPADATVPADVHRILGLGSSPLASYGGSGSFSIAIGTEAVEIVIRPDVRITRPVWHTGHQPGDEPMCILDTQTPHTLALRLPGWTGDVGLERILDDGAAAIPRAGPEPTWEVTPGRYRLVRLGSR
jgi:hypothetical protein